MNMSEFLSHRDVESLLGVYALDAVDGPDAEAVARHLRTCARCRAEVAQHRETAALLAFGGEEAPEQLWDRIAGALETASPPLDLSRLPLPPSRPSAQRSPVDTMGHPGPVGRRNRVGVSRRVLAALAAAAVVVVGILSYEVDSLQGQVGRNQVAEARPSLGQVIAAALTAPGRQLVALRPTAAQASSGSGATAEAVLLPNGHGYVVKADLPALPVTQTYQLWGLIGQQAISLGLLGPRPGPSSFQVSPGVSVKKLMVTVEPAGGVIQATSAPVVAGQPART